MAQSDADIDYIRRYGDNPNAPDMTPALQPAPATAPAATPSPYPRLFDPTSENASIANVNAAARATTLPGVGQLGSTPETDQTNLNVASAMERADLAGRIQPIPSVPATAMDEFAQQRQQIEQQKTQLMAKLGIVPPSAAGLAAVVLPSTQRPRGGGPSDYEKAFEQLHYLDNQSKQLLQEHHYSAIENARQAHEDLARNTHIQVSTGIAKMMNVISQANQQYGVGSMEAQKAIHSAYVGDDSDIAAARGTKSFEDRVSPYIQLHDLSALRAKTAHDAFVAEYGHEPTSVEQTSKGGYNLRYGTTKPAASPEDTAAVVATKELKPYGVTPAQIQNPVGAQVGRMAYTDKDGKPLPNPTFTPDSSGDVVRMGGTVTKGGKTPLVPIPIDTYLKHGGQLGAQDQAAQAAKSAGGQQIAPGNIDLNNRPVVRNADGTVSTEKSKSFNIDGKEVLIPTVAADGSGILSDQDAIKQYRATGQHLGIFSNAAAANAAAQVIHNRKQSTPAAAPAATAAPNTSNQVAQGLNTVTLTTAPSVITTQAERDAVPSGGQYIFNGKLYQKK